MKLKRIFIASYIFSIFLLFLYSFTQVDLDLTLSKIPFLHHLVVSFQYIGYFQRPISTYLFVGLLLILYGFYILFLRLTYLNLLSRKEIWTLVVSAAVILAFSYNAFSYDLFNYIFDAKIFTFYHQNPYIHKALDFPGDPMLTFMRWTHRTYPYGPVWLLITIPLSYLGFQLFTVTFVLFKFLMVGSYLGSALVIEKIMKKITKKYTCHLVFFALNPLVFIESIISAHIDIVMVLFSLWSIYLFMNRRHIRSLLLFMISVGIKFATILLFPIYIYQYFLHKTNKETLNIFVIYLYIILMSIGVVIESLRTNFQPWYLLIIIPFAAFVGTKKFVIIPTLIVTFLALSQYIPYLYTGNWNPPIPMILNDLLIGSIISSLLIVVVVYGFSYFLNTKK